MRRSARRLVRAAALAACCLLGASGVALGQATTSVGTSFASVTLSGTAELSPRTALRLPLDTLTYDLRPGADPQAVPACVIGATTSDVPTSGGGLGQPLVAPAGTTFRVTAFPNIEVVGGRSVPVPELPLGSRALVCYRSFVLGVFSNTANWQVSVDRLAAADEQQIERLYVGAACPERSEVGMYRLEAGQGATLVRSRAPGSCQELLVVVAVRPGGEGGGTAEASLRYTLVALDEEFGVR